MTDDNEEEYITLRAQEWADYRLYVTGLERRVADYEEDERRREERARERAQTTVAQEKRGRRITGSVMRIRLMYVFGWLSYAVIGGLIIALSIAALATSIPQAMAGDIMGWVPGVVLFAALVIPLMMSGYSRAQRPFAVLMTGLIGPLIIWGLVLLGDYAGIATILPATPAAT